MNEFLHSIVFYQPVNFCNPLEKNRRQNVNRFVNELFLSQVQRRYTRNIYIHFMQLHYYIS